MRLYGELHRFIPVLAAARGFRVGEIVIQHRPRRVWPLEVWRDPLRQGFLDLLTVKFLTGFGQRPQHCWAPSAWSASRSASGLAYLAGYWVVRQSTPDSNLPPLHERPALLYALGAFLVGAQLLSIGFWRK